MRALRFPRDRAEALKVRLAAMLPQPPAWRAPNAAEQPRNPQLGVNLHPALDYTPPIFADAMITARAWSSLDGAPLAFDAHGYPLSDASVLVWAGQHEPMHGVYQLTFTGQAELATHLSNARILNQGYDSEMNTTTAQLLVRDRGESALALIFRQTRRTPNHPLNSGIERVKLMRPLTPGACRSYAASELFIRPLLDKLTQFSVIRFMTFTATNWNVVQEWQDRVTPAAWSQQILDLNYGWEGKGAAWEYTILLCNQVNADAWINIPLRASDDYIRSLARLFRDGITIEGQIFPPLAPHLKIYIEYSNEIWSKTFTHGTWVSWQARQELGTGKSNLDFDGLGHAPRTGGMIENERVFAARWCARRVKEISEIWRAEFGDDAMMTRVRPLFAGAQSHVTAWQKHGLLFLDNYFNNAAGNFVAEPHPVNYYLYGGGGSAYNEGLGADVLESDALTADTFFQKVYPASREAYYQKQCENVDWSMVYGLAAVAYEAGTGLDVNGHSDAAKQQLQFDARIREMYLEQFHRFCEAGGALYMQFLIANDTHGLIRSIYDKESPKLQAVAEINRQSTPAPTHGVPIPATIAPREWNACSSTPRAEDAIIELKTNQWVSYTFRTERANALEIRVMCRANERGFIELAVDGRVVSVAEIIGGAGWQESGCRTSVQAGIHALRVRALTTALSLTRIEIES